MKLTTHKLVVDMEPCTNPFHTLHTIQRAMHNYNKIGNMSQKQEIMKERIKEKSSQKRKLQLST